MTAPLPVEHEHQSPRAAAHERPRIGVVKFASCDGCQLTLLDLEDELLAIAEKVDVVEFAEASSHRSSGPFDVLATGILNKKNGLLFYGTSGQALLKSELSSWCPWCLGGLSALLLLVVRRRCA